MTIHLTVGEYQKLNLPQLGKKRLAPTRKTLRDKRISQLRELGYPDWKIAIRILMERPKLNWGWKIEPEQRVCIEFADRMRLHVLEGRYNGIWGHLANEGKRHQIVAQILLAMGMIPGCTDYFFMWTRPHKHFNNQSVLDCGVIEFKSSGGVIQETQKLYAAMCQHFDIPHAYAYSADEAEAQIRAWGGLA